MCSSLIPAGHLSHGSGSGSSAADLAIVVYDKVVSQGCDALSNLEGVEPVVFARTDRGPVERHMRAPLIDV